MFKKKWTEFLQKADVFYSKNSLRSRHWVFSLRRKEKTRTRAYVFGSLARSITFTKNAKLRLPRRLLEKGLGKISL